MANNLIVVLLYYSTDRMEILYTCCPNYREGHRVFQKGHSFGLKDRDRRPVAPEPCTYTKYLSILS